MKKNINISGISDVDSKNIHKISSNLFKKGFLQGKQIGISVSESEDTEELGFSEVHIKDAIVEITRYLLTQGAKLIYGGDLRNNGYTYLFSELTFQYRNKEDSAEMIYTNYFSWPIHLALTSIDKAEFKKNRVFPILIDPSEDIPSTLKNTFIPFDKNENRFYWAKSLTKMRKEMIDNTDARIFIGGRLSGYKGSYPGVVEEFVLSLDGKTPLYLIGAFGGGVKEIINILMRMDNRLSEDFQFNDIGYKEFVTFYNHKEKENIDYKDLHKKITDYGLDALSKNNGLSQEENKRLFRTPHIPEIIFLILKGLKNKYKND